MTIIPWNEREWIPAGGDTKPHRPALFPLLFTEISQSSSISLSYHTIAFFTFYQSFQTNIMAQNTRILSVNMGDRNVQSGNITSSFNSYVYKSDEDAAITRWLSPLEPHNRHHSVRTERFGGVGGAGFWKYKSFGSGEVVRVELRMLFYFVPGIRGWERHI